jgi:hypothetical protein
MRENLARPTAPVTASRAEPPSPTEQFASIFRQIAREKRRHSGSMSRLFAGELAEKRREMRRERLGGSAL